MNPDFWLERWQRNQIGFHQPNAHAALAKYWSTLGSAPGERVFVPLAGKSRDMLWLRDQGFSVVGVELSDIAVRDFFEENGLQPATERRGDLVRYAAYGIELWCGDYFALKRSDIGPIQAVFDRAALIALPPSMRPSYVDRMNELCGPGTRTLLVTLEYDQTSMTGPPFSVPEDEVRALYGATHTIQLLERAANPLDLAKFAQHGVTQLSETVYRLERA